jgi:hypothetical protein
VDLNYLYHRHQTSIMRAEAAPSRGARHAHLGLATAYARLIETKRLDGSANRPAPLAGGPAYAV